MSAGKLRRDEFPSAHAASPVQKNLKELQHFSEIFPDFKKKTLLIYNCPYVPTLLSSEASSALIFRHGVFI